MKKEFYSWAIDTHSTEGHGYLGRYWFTHNIPPSSEGCRIALFATRRIAREHLAKVKEGWASPGWQPKVSRVKVVIESV